MKHQELCDKIVFVLKKEKNPVTCSELQKKIGGKIADSQIRKAVKTIQRNGNVKYLISDHYGFYITRRKKAVTSMIDMLKKRRDSLNSLIKNLSNSI